MHNLSLSGCGFLGIYHIGVISAFREHAPEFLLDKISGCSAGSLVAACAICDCCLGQMVSDVLEIALKARSHALGPLHPSFNIVEILKNGLRRILPVDAHKICSGRLHVSITRWKDGKNFLVNKFESREDLIQALICSSFVPGYSGIVPPKFRGVYFWDGGLSNNNPILNQETILVSPFAGESDICPRDESGAWHCLDFQGTNVQWSYENMYRISKALFPPHPEVLKAICFRGYKDGISFLKSRNLLQCSCRFPRERLEIESVSAGEVNELSMFDSEFEDDNEYDSEEDKIMQYAHSVKDPLTYKEMPSAVLQILDAACDDNKGVFQYFYDSPISRAISIMFIPWTLPVEFWFGFTKKMVELLPKIKVAKNPKSLVDLFLIYVNFLIHKFTYDKYQYHTRVICKLCNHTKDGHSHANGAKCNHVKSIECTQDDEDPGYEEVKMCARHRMPSVTGSVGSYARLKSNRYRRTRSYVSTNERDTNDLSSIVSDNSMNVGYDLDRLIKKNRKRIERRANKFEFGIEKDAIKKTEKSNSTSNLNKMDIESIMRSRSNSKMNLNMIDTGLVRRSSKSKLDLETITALNQIDAESSVNFKYSNAHSAFKRDNTLADDRDEIVANSRIPNKAKVRFSLDSGEENGLPQPEVSLEKKNIMTSAVCQLPQVNTEQVFSTKNLTDDTKAGISKFVEKVTDELADTSVMHETAIKETSDACELMTPASENQNSDSKIGWDTYWDKLESNVLGIGPT